jgi:hypothetical protein
LHGAGPGEHENPRADNRADTQKRQIERPQRFFESGALRAGEHVLDAFLTEQGHER